MMQMFIRFSNIGNTESRYTIARKSAKVSIGRRRVVVSVVRSFCFFSASRLFQLTALCDKWETDETWKTRGLFGICKNTMWNGNGLENGHAYGIKFNLFWLFWYFWPLLKEWIGIKIQMYACYLITFVLLNVPTKINTTHKGKERLLQF